MPWGSTVAGDDTLIRIGGDSRGAVQAIEDVSRAADGARRSLAQMASAESAASTASANAWKERADNINVWKRAASGVAPQLTGMIDSMEEFAEGAERVGGSTMAARVGILALGTAWTAAAAATVAAGAAIVASSIEVVTNLDAYSGVATRHRAALQDAATSTAGLHREITELRVEIAGQMAPTIGYASDVLAGMVIALDDAVVGVGDLSEAVGISAHDLAAYVPVVGSVVQVFDMLADKAAAARIEAAGAAAGAAAAARIMGGGKFDMQADAAAQGEAQAAADAMMLVSAREVERTTRAVTAARVEQAPVVDEAIRQATELAERYQTQWQILQDLDDAERARTDAILASVAAQQTTVTETIGYTQSAADEAANAATAAAGRVRSAWTDTVGSVVGTASSVLGTLSSIISEYTDMQVGSMEHADARQRAIMRERFRREKANAIAMAVVQGALSVVQTLASTPYPANIVLGVLQAAAVGVQIGIMSRQQPTYHRGGLAPDEALTSGGARVLQSETMAVYSDRRAPSEGDVARAQTGERDRPESAPVPSISVIMDGVARGVRQFARSSAGYTPGRMAYGV